MRYLKNLSALLFVVLLFSGCEKEITVDLETAPAKLVIDAGIIWQKGTTGSEQTIKLSTSTGYYDSHIPAVSGAEINVVNSAGGNFVFAETNVMGEYRCTNFIPAINATYTLTVKLNGQTYKAVEKLTGCPQIEPEIVQKDNGGIAGDEIEVQYFYHDNGMEDNYYLNRIVTSHVAFPQYSTASDEFYQGNRITEFYSHADLAVGDHIQITLYGINQRYYDYFNKILLASGSDDGPFPSIPASVRGNVVNQTNHDNFALGYFRLSEVDIKNYVVK